jgi:acylphosphatase
MVRRRVVVRGFVKGVGFRVSLVQVAQSRGVSGWVGNRPDGAVEAVFEGEAEAVESMVRWCRSGPRGADVDEVEVRDEAPEGLRGFDVRRY